MAPGQSKLGRPSLWNRWTSVVRLDAQHPDRSLQRHMHDMRGRHFSSLFVICKNALAPGGAPRVLMLGLTPPPHPTTTTTHTHLSLAPCVFFFAVVLPVPHQCHQCHHHLPLPYCCTLQSCCKMGNVGFPKHAFKLH